MGPDPYFNEPGYESSRGTMSGDSQSRKYNDNIKLRNVQQAMIAQLRTPTPGFEEVIQTHFYLKQDEILQQVKSWKILQSEINTLESLLKSLEPPKHLLE